MLDAFIIEEIIRREERHERPRPALHAPSHLHYELPSSPQPVPDSDEHDDDDDEHDGVIIIDM